ncbi:MAG: GWxTD domain-containing protein [Balneolaceae bacterium]
MKGFCNILKASVVLILAGWVLSCSRASNPDIERGAPYQFQDGHPEIRMSALGYLDENDNGIISVAADIVEGSLIYREVENQNQAEIEIEVRIVGIEGTEHSDNYRTDLTIHNQQEGYVTTQDVINFERDMQVPPGFYEVVVVVIDKASGKQTTRTTQTTIPDPSDNVLNLTSVQLLAKSEIERNGTYQPVTTYDVPARKDSIRFLIQVTNNRSEDPLIVNSRLIRFRSDTTAARPMSFNNYSPSSIPYKGIDYSNEEELETTRRVLEQPGSVMIEYRFPLPQRGNYRFEVNAESENTEGLFKARDFGIKSANYPSIKAPRELAEPLAYLMNDKEYENLLSIGDSDSLKEAIDRFWLSNVQSTSRARNVISLYYERVEEANKQFSNFKEGWKTDPGMIYILFGPPWYVEQRLNYMQWSYSYDRNDPRYNYYFERPKMKNEFFPFNNYLLQRSQNYFNLQYQQVQLWKSGQILNTNM